MNLHLCSRGRDQIISKVMMNNSKISLFDQEMGARWVARWLMEGSARMSERGALKVCETILRFVRTSRACRQRVGLIFASACPCHGTR